MGGKFDDLGGVAVNAGNAVLKLGIQGSETPSI
jgi:hypothetical protein